MVIVAVVVVVVVIVVLILVIFRDNLLILLFESLTHTRLSSAYECLCYIDVALVVLSDLSYDETRLSFPDVAVWHQFQRLHVLRKTNRMRTHQTRRVVNI